MTETIDAPSGAPTPGLGRNYAKLWTASGISNLGDGIDGAALPLLAATLTRDPVLFSGVAVASRIPWLLFSLQAGAIADRVDRQRLMATVNVVRFLLMGGLAALVAFDMATIWILYAISFGLGIAEVLFDNTAQTLLPSLVPKGQLERANGRLFGVEIVTNQFAGPPIGGVLFAIAAAIPLAVDAVTFLVSAVLIALLTGRFRVERSLEAARPRIRQDIAEGLRWLWGHRLLRTLGLLLGLMNGLTAGGFAISALYALEVLEVSEIGFGLLLTTSAIGSVIGSMAAGRVVERVGRGPVLIATIAGNGAAFLGMGLTDSPYVFGALMASFGLLAVMWNVVTVSLRQTIIPDHLLGRVNSVYRFLGWGSIPVGSLLGGLLADALGLAFPFVLAGSVLLVATLAALPVINSRAIEEARAEADRETPPSD